MRSGRTNIGASERGWVWGWINDDPVHVWIYGSDERFPIPAGCGINKTVHVFFRECERHYLIRNF